VPNTNPHTTSEPTYTQICCVRVKLAMTRPTIRVATPPMTATVMSRTRWFRGSPDPLLTSPRPRHTPPHRSPGKAHGTTDPAARMTTEAASTPVPAARMTGKGARHRPGMPRRACRTRKPAREPGEPGKPPTARFPGSPGPPPAFPPARGRAARATTDSHTAPTPAAAETSTLTRRHPQPGPGTPARPHRRAPRQRLACGISACWRHFPSATGRTQAAGKPSRPASSRRRRRRSRPVTTPARPGPRSAS
jgi:hypothetical protein